MSSFLFPMTLAARQSCWAMLASMALHLGLLAVLGGWWLPAAPESRPDSLQSDWVETVAEPEELHLAGELSPTLSAIAGGGGQGGTRPSRIPVRADHALTLSRLPDIRDPLPGESPLTAADLVAGITGTKAASSGSGGGLGGGKGRGIGTGTGDGTGNGTGGFFTTGSPTGRYVFVVDSSRSMNHRWHGPAKTRFGRVKVELWRTIYQMVPEQKYFVIFFNTRALPMPAEGLMPGGAQNQTRFLEWTARHRADGQTDPQQALLLALQMRPDVIYFLTDGEFNYKVVREVSAANFGSVKIHTISLGDDAGGDFLKELADRNGGTYRHIVEADDIYWTQETPLASPGEEAPAAGGGRRDAAMVRGKTLEQ